MSLSKRPNKAVSAARGAVLVVAMRWVDRLIGLVSTLILARLLVPDDFGIVAMASVVVGLIDTLLDLGVGSALIQNRDAGREDFDTAWTLRIIQALGAALILWFSAPLAAEYFRDARVLDVIRVMALAMLIGGFENIGIVAFQKNMEFGSDFRFFFFRRLAGFIVTISLAFWLHSYWAMVIGALVGRSAGVGLSFWMHDFRPRISFSRFRKLWSFSQWVLIRNLGVYGQNQLDKFLVGRRTDATTMGAYTLADEVAAMPTTELLAPLGRVLFPVFVKAADDAEKLRAVFCKAIGVQSLLALPAGVGLALVARDAVLVLLGDKWLIAVPFLQVLALISIFGALSHSSAYLLLSLGKLRLQAWLAWTQLVLMGALVLVFFPQSDVMGVAYARLLTSGCGFLIITGLVIAYVEAVQWRDFFRHTSRPLIASGTMVACLIAMPIALLDIPLMRLLVQIGAGAAIYAGALLLLWRLCGCPDGAEAYLLEQVGMKGRLLRWMRV